MRTAPLPEGLRVIPAEMEMVLRRRGRAPRSFQHSPRGKGGPRQAYSSVRQPTEPDEGSLPPPRPPVACPAQPRVGRIPSKWLVPDCVVIWKESAEGVVGIKTYALCQPNLMSNCATSGIHGSGRHGPGRRATQRSGDAESSGVLPHC